MKRSSLWITLLVLPLSAQPIAPAALIVGTYTSDHQPIVGSKITVRSEFGQSQEALTTKLGEAEFKALAPGFYQVSTAANSYADLTVDVEVKSSGTNRVDATLVSNKVQSDSITVESGVESPVEQGVSPPTALKREEIKNLPGRPATVADALPLAPGVVRLPDGLLRLSGSGEHRSALLVNSANVTNPATGQFGATIPIDSVQILNVLSSPFLAEYGGFTANVVSVETRKAGEKWHFEINDPLPEFRFRSWHMQGLKTATPRASFGGALIPQRLYMLESIQYEMRTNSIITLPFPYNQQRTEGVNSFTELDYTVNASNVVNATIHIADQHIRFANLDYFNPEQTTPNTKNATYAFTVADHASLKGGLLESELSLSSYRDAVWSQGNAMMVIGPTGNQGNYYAQQTRTASRAELREIYSFAKDCLGTHNFKFGAVLGGTAEHGLVHENPVDLRDAAGALVETLRFTPGQPIARSDMETAIFGQDNWVINSRFAISSGIRAEQQRITDTFRVGPREGFVWTPWKSGHTVLRGGVGLFYDRVPLNVYGFSSYPNQIITQYSADGFILNGPTQFYNLTEAAARSEAPFVYAEQHPGNFAPFSLNWNVQLEQTLSSRLRIRANYLQSSSDGLITLTPRSVQNTNAYVLNGNGSAKLKQLEVTAAIRGGAGSMLYFSYVRSHSIGNLNEFNSYLSNYPPAVILPDRYGNMAGDVPNRFILWGTIRLPMKLQLMPKVECRSGFPYSSLTVLQQYAGAANQTRFPGYLSADARLSKDFKISDKYTVRFAVSGSNLTDHFNPVSVHSNVADPQYGTFFGQFRRRYTADFDFLF